MNICINAGGGLGDILRVYLSGQVGYPWCHPFWGQLEEWRQDTGGKIRLVIASHNPSAKQFFEYVPWIDEIISIPWEDDGTLIPAKYADKNYIAMIDYEIIALCSQYEWRQPKIYLSPDEQNEFNLIMKSGKKKVLIYPFGGYGAKIKPEKYIYLIEKLLELEYEVILVGDSHYRNVKDETDYIQEEFDYAKSGVFNLIGRDSCRLTSLLAFSSDLYIGSLGCYMHAAFGRCVKSTILTHKTLWENHSVFGSAVLRNDSLWYLRRYVGTYEKEVDLICIYNEKKLKSLWDRIIQRMCLLNSISSEYLPWEK